MGLGGTVSKHSVNGIFNRQVKRLIPATSKRATIVAINVSARTVDVYFIENPQSIIRSIPISNAINPVTLAAGMQVGVDTYNESTPSSMVITYVIDQGQQVTSLYFVSVPASATSPGLPGQVSWDASFYYICIAPNVWRRVAISSF